jgi:antitoxin (DNA-binding transcriptional repressor) of toxin-antitoxin stability system
MIGTSKACSGKDILSRLSFLKGDRLMKIIPVVEMQTRLSELLSQFPNEIIQVTYQGTAVVAVLPQERYQTFREDVAPQQKKTFEITRASLTETQHLFHSYRNRLAPHLQGNDDRVNIIEVMRRKRLIGAILAWDDWLSLAGSPAEESEASGQNDVTLTIVAARNHLLKLADQFANEEQHGVFTPITVTRQGTPVMAIVPWGWFQRVTHFLKMQIVPFMRIKPDGSLIISSNEEGIPEKGEHEGMADYIGELSLLWSRFHKVASTIAFHMSSLTDAHLYGTPAFDHACAELEDQCVKAQQIAQELLAMIQVVPIHAAIMKQYASLPDGIDQPALREVETLARMTYEQTIMTGNSKRVAWEAARQACLAWALQRSWSHGQFRLSRDIEQLVENVLIQVKELVER